MTQLLGAAVLWGLLVATVVAVLVPSPRRWAWLAAQLLAALWLGVDVSVPVAAALAAGVAVATVVEGGGAGLPSDFSSLMRAILAAAAGLLAGAFVLVRVVHAEVALAEVAYPAVAAAAVALAAVVFSPDLREQGRAMRLLAVLGIAAWTWATDGSPWVSAMAVLWLPAMAGAVRVAAGRAARPGPAAEE